MQHSRPERVQRESDCAFESICETCSYFHTSIEFRPALTGPDPPKPVLGGLINEYMHAA